VSLLIGKPARSYGVKTQDGAIVEETDAYTCGHHNGIVLAPKHPKPGDDMGGFCHRCMQNICGPCADEMARTLKCIPFEKRLDRMESKEAAQKSLYAEEKRREEEIAKARRFGTDSAEIARMMNRPLR
jgi:hypothetical protein